MPGSIKTVALCLIVPHTHSSSSMDVSIDAITAAAGHLRALCEPDSYQRVTIVLIFVFEQKWLRLMMLTWRDSHPRSERPLRKTSRRDREWAALMPEGNNSWPCTAGSRYLLRCCHLD
jgi:hypothetical protein